MLYADPDTTIGVDLKSNFADRSIEKGPGTVRKYVVRQGHAGDAWLQGSDHIINGIQDTLPHLNLLR